MYIQEGICNRYVFTNREIAEWQALRDYQDAERKKGTPIYADERPKGWFARDYDMDGLEYIFDSIGKDRFLVIDIFDPSNEVILGRFTNFRWRAGYPKGGSHDA